MAGVKGRSGPPGNANAFRHGLATIDKSRQNGAPLTGWPEEKRDEIFQGLVEDKGGGDAISTAQRELAVVIADDIAWDWVCKAAIKNVLSASPKAAKNPKALAKLDSYRRPVVNSIAANLQRFGFNRVAKTLTLQDLYDQGEEEENETEKEEQA